jgi:Na+/melibiose symporter-like transporter
MLVIPSFAGIFVATPSFLNTNHAKAIWYCVLPALFNVGWASVQISHMAIVNSLTFSMTKRDRMVTNRNALTYAANIAVLSLSLVLFLVIKNSVTCFTVLCLVCLGGGLLTTFFYTS